MNYSRDEIIKQLGIVAENDDKKREKLQKDYILKCYLEGTKAEFNESEFNRLRRYHDLIIQGNPDSQKTFFERANASNVDNILSEIEQAIIQEVENGKSRTNEKKGATKRTTLYNQLKKTYGEALTFKLFGTALEWSGLADKDSYTSPEVQKLEQTCSMYFNEQKTPQEIREFQGIEGESAEATPQIQEQIVESLAIPTAERLAQTMVKQTLQTERELGRAIQLRAMGHLFQMVSSGEFEKMAQEERNRLLAAEIQPIQVIETTSQKVLAPETKEPQK